MLKMCGVTCCILFQPWAPVGMGKLALAPPPRKCCSVLCISIFRETLGRPNIFALFSQFFVGFWRLCLQTTKGSTLDPAGEFSFSDPLICPPLEKILRAPMVPAVFNNNNAINNTAICRMLEHIVMASSPRVLRNPIKGQIFLYANITNYRICI